MVRKINLVFRKLLITSIFNYLFYTITFLFFANKKRLCKFWSNLLIFRLHICFT